MTIIDDQEQTSDSRISRRTFVGVGGALVVSFTLPRYLNPASALAQAPLPPVIPPDYPVPAPVSPVPTAPEGLAANAVDSWLRVGADNNVTIFSGKCELGTGTATATLQIAADQLSVAMDQLHLVEPDTWLTVDQGYSSGSMTMKTQWAAGVRQACAAARAQLLDLASTYLGQPVSALTVANGTVSVQGDSARYVTYGELIGDQLMNTKITVNVSPVPPGPGQLVGKSVQRVDIPDKVTAKFS
jgi:nicotinate dehydrogenase subunit B